MTNTKQTKITQFTAETEDSEDCDELQEEIKQLELELKERQDELFQLERNNYRYKVLPPKKKQETFIRPQKIILKNSIESLKRNLEVMTMLSGMEVQSYLVNDHCSIVYHMQHDAQHVVKHGLRIEMKSGVKEVSRCSLPLGFNLNAVLNDYDNIMMPDCLRSIRKALVAYNDRLEQYEALKKLVNIEAQLFKVIDGSHIEISFMAQSDMEEEGEQMLKVVLMLDYRLYDIRPKMFAFNEIELPEGAAEALRQQCTMFKSKPLRAAFKEAFITGIGPYKLAKQVGPQPRAPPRRKPRRAPPPHAHNDDTFRPEDCSDQSGDSDSDH